MLIKFSLLVLIYSLFFEDCAIKNIFFQLGKSKCSVRIYEKQKPIANIIALHGNENTCIKSFLKLSKSCPFALYELRQGGNRLLTYDFNHTAYSFDPNRMFSNKGLINSLKKNNKSYPADLAFKIKHFRDTLLHIIIPQNPSTYVIAIHNNTNGDFSVKSYLHSANATQVYVCKSSDPDDFFIVTQIVDFSFFKSRFQNVVLQNKFAKDDGSLSIYCQAKNIPYINVEVQDGHVNKQIEMLRLCQNLLQKKI